MVEQEAVNFEVAGSSPAAGAMKEPTEKWVFSWPNGLGENQAFA
jgi:hypothetical protein